MNLLMIYKQIWINIIAMQDQTELRICFYWIYLKFFFWISILKSKVYYAHFHYVLSFYYLGDNNISEKIPNSASILRLHIPSGLNVIYFCKYIWNHEFISI